MFEESIDNKTEMKPCNNIEFYTYTLERPQFANKNVIRYKELV